MVNMQTSSNSMSHLPLRHFLVDLINGDFFWPFSNLKQGGDNSNDLLDVISLKLCTRSMDGIIQLGTLGKHKRQGSFCLEAFFYLGN